MKIRNIEIPNPRCADPNSKTCNGCPCVITEESEIISNYGCLPDWNMLVEFYLDNKGIWKCHSADRPCGGLLQVLKENKIPLDKNNKLLITEDNPLLSEIKK